jgi:hypothetical protein
MTVDDTMTPRLQIEYIDLKDDLEDIRSALSDRAPHAPRRVRRRLDNVVGIVHVRKVLNMTRREQVEIEGLRQIMRDPYFVPQGTALLNQLQNFQENQRHMGLVVDEYGDLLGLVTMKDILEEIVGEFTSQAIGSSALFHREADGSVIAGRLLFAARPQPQGGIRVSARGAEDDQRAAPRGARGHSRSRHAHHARRPSDRDHAGAEPHGEGREDPAEGAPPEEAEAA